MKKSIINSFNTIEKAFRIVIITLVVWFLVRFIVWQSTGYIIDPFHDEVFINVSTEDLAPGESPYPDDVEIENSDNADLIGKI